MANLKQQIQKQIQTTIQPSRDREIRIRTMAGDGWTIAVHPTDTMLYLKTVMESMLNVPLSLLTMMYVNQEDGTFYALPDSYTVSSLSDDDDSVLTIVVNEPSSRMVWDCVLRKDESLLHTLLERIVTFRIGPYLGITANDTIWLMDRFIPFLKETSTLRHLYIGGEFPPTHIRALADAVRDNQSLESLTLDVMSMTAPDSVYVLESIVEHKTLVTLQLSRVKVDDRYHEPYATRVRQLLTKPDSTLTALNVSRTEVNDIMARAIADSLMTNQTVTTLNLSMTTMTSEGTQSILQSLQANTTVTSLDLSEVSLVDKQIVDMLGEALHSLKSLRVSTTMMGDNISILFAAILANNQTMESLDISSNEISQSSATVLADLLLTHPTLQTLNISDCSLHEESAIHVFESLRVNHTLTTLHASAYSRNAQKSIVVLADVLKTNQSLRTLDLAMVNIKDEGVMALADALRHNHTLTSLDLSAIKTITNDCIPSLSESLRVNDTLTSLILSYTWIDNASVPALAAMLQQNHHLIHLDLAGTKLNDIGIHDLVDVLSDRTTPLTLDLTHTKMNQESIALIDNVMKRNPIITIGRPRRA